MQAELEYRLTLEDFWGKSLFQILAKFFHTNAIGFFELDVELGDPSFSIGISYRDTVNIGDRIAWASVVANRFSEDIVLVIHQDPCRLKPGLTVGFTLEG